MGIKNPTQLKYKLKDSKSKITPITTKYEAIVPELLEEVRI